MKTNDLPRVMFISVVVISVSQEVCRHQIGETCSYFDLMNKDEPVSEINQRTAFSFGRMNGFASSATVSNIVSPSFEGSDDDFV